MYCSSFRSLEKMGDFCIPLLAEPNQSACILLWCSVTRAANQGKLNKLSVLFYGNSINIYISRFLLNLEMSLNQININVNPFKVLTMQ